MNDDQTPESRAFPRRQLPPVAVLLSQPDQPDIPAQLIDYSPDGMRLRVDKPILAGAVLTVRPAQGAAGHPGIEVHVQHCRVQKNQWHLGCKFTARQHWDDLSIFG